MSEDEQSARMRILEMIESGRISAEDGLRLLGAMAGQETGEDEESYTSEAAGAEMALGQPDEAPLPADEATAGQSVNAPGAPADAPEVTPAGIKAVAPSNSKETLPTRNQADQAEVEVIAAPASPVSEDQGRESRTAPLSGGPPPELAKWRRWWTVPLWIGVGITVFGGLLMYWALQSAGLSLWFACASLPFTLGVIVLVLAWQSRTAPWLHLRVNQAPGESPQRIAFSFPLPIGPTAWLLRHFGRYIPNLEDTALDEVILAVGKYANSETPIYIQVNEGDEGERVEIYIG